MDADFQHEFQGMQELDGYCANDELEDMPLSNELLDGFGMEFYQGTAPGGLPSPNSSHPDLPGSGQQSPILPSLSLFTGGYDFQPGDGTSDAHDDILGSHILQQAQESQTYTGSNTSNNHFNTFQTLQNASSNSPKPHVLHGEPLVTSSSYTDVGQCQNLMAPSDDSLCNSSQNRASTVPSESSVEQIVPIWRPTSTQASIAPKVVNDTQSASASANLQHSPTSKAQHFVRHPSLLRHQIHSELPQYSPLTATAEEDYITGRMAHTMSSGSNFTKRQGPNPSPSYSNYQNVYHASNRPQLRQINSAQSQSRGSPVSQNYQPFQESSLRSSVTPNSGQDFWEAGQFQVPQYPDPQPIFQQQFNRSPYIGHHHFSESRGSCMSSDSSEQYLVQTGDTRNVSFLTSDYGFNGSSPMSIKCELSSPDSDQLVCAPILRSQLASPKPQKKRRVKHELKNNDDNDAAVDPVALQTLDLTNLDPTDHTNVATLIEAMHNTDNVEDNQGMQKTWEKVRKAKAFRIREVCVELLNLAKQAQQQNGNPLGEKRSVNYYASFEKRFDALCETLMFQKTVCKHLIEPPYSYSVVDDPQNAKDRVKNNRRVNHQKAEAIRLGREHLGEKGQGKGKPMLKTKKRARALPEDSQDDEENSGDEPPSDAETDVLPHVLGPKSARPNPRAPKKAKRVSRPKNQPVNGVMTPTSPSQSSNITQHQEHRGRIRTSYSPQIQDSEDNFAQDVHQNAYSPNQRIQILLEHNRMPQGLTSSQQLPTLNQHYDFGNESGQVFYGDRSIAGSDSEGLGAIGCDYK